MKRDIQTTRRKYKDFFEGTVIPNIGISQDDIAQLSFADIASRIDNLEHRETFRRLAIRLLEENLEEHHDCRPSAVELLDKGNLSELYEWQDVLFTWERAIAALAGKRVA